MGATSVITADARIDNREELLTCLSISTSQKDSIPDSILILKSYEKWGENCPQYLLGEFAFAIWNKRDKRLFCARDHIGFRPLFYYHCNYNFIFASEIKGMRSLDFIPLQFNEMTLATHLLPLEKDNGQTFFEGILRLKCAHILAISRDNKVRYGKYWAPEPQNRFNYSSDSDYAEALRDIIINSVSCRLRTNLPVSVSLSGGLDSSAIACIAARQLREKGQSLIAVSSVLPVNHQGIETDERNYIQAVLDQEPNIDIQFVTAAGKGPFDFPAMERGIQQIESPLPAVFYMNQALWQAARDKGARCMLNGEGGDHMVSYQSGDALYRLYRDFRWIAGFDLIKQLRIIEEKGVPRILRDNFLRPLLPAGFLNLFFYVKGKITGQLKNPVSAIKPEFQRRYGIDPIKMMGYANITARDYRQFIISKIQRGKLAIEDLNIKHSHYNMENHCPFLDKRIIEFFMTVPPEKFFMGGKKRGLFRHAMEGILPPLIQWRNDKGTFTPDFHQRVLLKQQEAKAFLDSLSKDDPARKYLDLDIIREQFKYVSPVRNREQWETKTQRILVKNIILIKFLHWINKMTGEADFSH
jgi:asparagine synthase (glutamine-hydrolysing)